MGLPPNCPCRCDSSQTIRKTTVRQAAVQDSEGRLQDNTSHDGPVRRYNILDRPNDKISSACRLTTHGILQQRHLTNGIKSFWAIIKRGIYGIVCQEDAELHRRVLLPSQPQGFTTLSTRLSIWQVA